MEKEKAKKDFSVLDNVLNNISTKTGTNGKKQSVYNDSAFLHIAKKFYPTSFDGANIIPSKREKLMKDTRKKIRVLLFSALESIEKANKANNKNLLNSAVKSFNDFYKSLYQINDYSLNSLCSNNMSNENKEYINKILPIIVKANKPVKESKTQKQEVTNEIKESK